MAHPGLPLVVRLPIKTLYRNADRSRASKPGNVRNLIEFRVIQA